MAINIIKGSDATVKVSLKDKKTGDLFDLSGFSGATAYFDQAESDEPLAVTGELEGSADTGRLSFPLTEVQTDLLEAGDDINMEVVLDQGTTRTIVQFEAQISVKPRLF